MARKRVAHTGRFAKKETTAGAGAHAEASGATGCQGGAEPQAPGTLRKAPGPRHCRTFARARFAEALPEIAETMVSEAKKGSVAHVKMLVQLSGIEEQDAFPKGRQRKAKTLETILLEEWERFGVGGRQAKAEEEPGS